MYLYVPKLHFMTFYPYSDLNQNMVKLGGSIVFFFFFCKSNSCREYACHFTIYWILLYCGYSAVFWL